MSAARFAILFLAAAAAAAGAAPAARAQNEVTVYSARPNAVAVTIYREDLALITPRISVSASSASVTESVLM